MSPSAYPQTKRALDKKLYYSIGEVAELTGLQPYTLRSWEKEFSCLRPRRVRGKNRAYRERDIGVILLIKRLLYEDRYSTRGVQQKLKDEPELVRGASGNLLSLHRPSATIDNKTSVQSQVPNTDSSPVISDKESTSNIEKPNACENKVQNDRENTREDEQLKQLVLEVRSDLQRLLNILS